MAEFYIPSMTAEEGYKKLKWVSKLEGEKPLIISEDGKVWNGNAFYIIGKTVFPTKLEAQNKAKDMIERKIRSLKNDLENIESYMS